MIDDEIREVLEVAGLDPQHIVARPGNDVRGDHLRPLLNLLDEGLVPVLDVLSQRHMNDGFQLNAQPLGIQHRAIAGDDSFAFQQAQPAQARRG
ncbi:hypothetical protein D3C85_1036470 [compost metagenome]